MEKNTDSAGESPGPGDPPPPEPIPDVERFVRLGLFFYAGLLVLVALAWLLSGRSPLYASPGAAAAGIAWVDDLGIGLLSGALAIALSALFTSATRVGRRLADGLAALLGPLRWRDCLILALASGVGEEALFRGVLQPLLGWVGASLLFGLVHFAPRRDLLPWTGFAILAGFGLGGLFEATGNLVAPIVAHALINAVNLRLLASRRWPATAD